MVTDLGVEFFIGRASTLHRRRQIQVGKDLSAIMCEKGGRQGSATSDLQALGPFSPFTPFNPYDLECPKTKLSFNPADGPPPHPEKVIMPFGRPTNSSRTSTAKTTSYLPVKASKHAPYHTAQTLAAPKICNSKTLPQRSKEQLALSLPCNAQPSRSQDGDFFASLSFDVRHMMYIQVPRR